MSRTLSVTAQRTLAVLLAIVVAAASAVAQQPAPSSPATAIDELFQKAYAPSEPGAAVIVVRDGKTILRTGYGMADLELGVKVEPDMVFRLGSVTKQFTAVAILMLAEQGKLSLGDEITTFFPDYPTHGKRITVEHLLTHTSGIKSYTSMPEWRPLWRKDMTVKELVDLFKDQPMDFAPGERWSYNNSGYILLGAIIEKISGQSYETFLDEQIFKPLGMAHTYYDRSDRVIPRRVPGYAVTRDGYRNANYLSMTQPYAAGSLASTVDDLAIWGTALSSGKLVKPAALSRAWQQFKLDDGSPTGYGYGWMMGSFDGYETVEHGGDIFGFSSYTLWIPKERVFVAVLMNKESNEVSPEELAFRAAAIAAGRPLREPTAIELPATTLDAYVGVYDIAGGATRTITREGDRLYSQRAGGPKFQILPISEGEFAYPEDFTRARFERGADGKVAGMTMIRRLGPPERAKRTDKPLPQPKVAIALDPSTYDRFVGEYEIRPGFAIAVRREGSALMTQATGQQAVEVFPESETKFFLKVVDAQIEFVRDASGVVTNLILRQGGREIPAKKVR